MTSRFALDRRMRLGLVVVSLIGLLVALAFSQVLNTLLQPGGRTVTAVFANTAQLRKGDKVRMSGVDVGRVKTIALDGRRRTATVKLTVYDDAFPLYGNATAAIRWRTVLGGSFAVDLARGDAASGRLAGAIPVTQTSNQVELDDVLTAVRGTPQSGLQTLLDETPKALRDPQLPAEALAALADASPDLRRGVSAVRGRRRDDLRALVRTSAATARALSTPAEEIRSVVQDGARTMRAVADRRADVTATVRAAGVGFPRVRTHVDRLGLTLASAQPVLDALREVSPRVAPTVRALRPVVADAARLLTRARPLTRALRPAAHDLAAAARDAAPLVADLQPSIERANTKILPGLAVRDAVSQRTTYQMIGPTVASLAGAMGQFDGAGMSFFRFPISARESAVDTLPCKAILTDPERQDLVTCDTLGNLLQTYANFLTGRPPKR